MIDIDRLADESGLLRIIDDVPLGEWRDPVERFADFVLQEAYNTVRTADPDDKDGWAVFYRTVLAWHRSQREGE